MKKVVLSMTVAIALVLIACVTYAFAQNKQAEPKAQTASQVVVTPPTRSELLALVNEERAKNGVAPLKEDPRLDQSAQMKADDEIKYGYFGHISPTASPNAGKDSHDFIFNTGISCVDSSENLTENTFVNDSAHAIAAWIKSAPHHTAMLDTRYSLTGFGISGDQIVEHFCQVN